MIILIHYSFIFVGERVGELREAGFGSMNEESQVRGCYNYNNITFIHTNQETVCVGKDTSKQNISNMKLKANVKSKQQQLSNKYSNHVVYL